MADNEVMLYFFFFLPSFVFLLCFFFLARLFRRAWFKIYLGPGKKSLLILTFFAFFFMPGISTS